MGSDDECIRAGPPDGVGTVDPCHIPWGGYILYPKMSFFPNQGVFILVEPHSRTAYIGRSVQKGGQERERRRKRESGRKRERGPKESSRLSVFGSPM